MAWLTLLIEEIAMFQVQAPVVIVPSAEARAALGAQLRPAALAAWREIARRGQGIEMAYFQIVHTGVTLAVCSRIRSNGFIEIGLGLGDPRQAARVIPAAQLRQAEARVQPRRGHGGATVLMAKWGQHSCPHKAAIDVDGRGPAALDSRLRKNPAAPPNLPRSFLRQPPAARRSVVSGPWAASGALLVLRLTSGSDAHVAYPLCIQRLERLI